MSRFAQIDLSKLPAPDLIEVLDFEAIVADLKAFLSTSMPELAEVLALESEPVTMLIEAFAYREMILRGRINDVGRANMLATATGADLENLAALLGVVRLLITPADPNVSPATEPVYEDDAALRSRAQLALEGFTTAGPVGAYEFHARSASGLVADVDVASPAPGEVVVTVLSKVGDGVPDAALLAIVEAALSDGEMRPLGTLLTVAPATLHPYAVEAVLHIAPGPDASVVIEAARASVAAYVAQCHALGATVAEAGLKAALWQGGVSRIELLSPAADIIAAPTVAPICTAITVTRAET